MFILALFLAILFACRPAASPLRGGGEGGDPATGTLARPTARPPVIRGPTVVAFWLPASDTLRRGQGADVLDDFRHYTAQVAPYLEAAEIALVATTAESVIVELDRGPSRVIMLAGLDFPFGYVLVEPGYPETILTGVSTDEELLDEVDWYFGLDEGDERGSPRGGARPRPEPVLQGGRGCPGPWALSLTAQGAELARLERRQRAARLRPPPRCPAAGHRSRFDATPRRPSGASSPSKASSRGSGLRWLF